MNLGEHGQQVQRPYISPEVALKQMLKKLDSELIIIELFAFAAYFGDSLHKDDYNRCLQAIRRCEVLRGGINARLQ
jgi:hypothetical protein